MNAEFQRIERRDNKVFLSDQCKETEENNMEKTRDPFRKLEIPREYFKLEGLMMKLKLQYFGHLM